MMVITGVPEPQPNETHISPKIFNVKSKIILTDNELATEPVARIWFHVLKRL